MAPEGGGPAAGSGGTAPPVTAPSPAPGTAPAALYAEVERFYARQAQLLGEGRLDQWALTFTEDAVFEQEAQAGRVWTGNAPSARRGRAAIVAAARGAVAARREAAAVRRYLIGMLTLSPATDAATDAAMDAAAGTGTETGAGTCAGALRTRYRAVLLQTPEGGAPEVYLSTTGRDVLVRQDGDWRVRHRINSHDNAPAGSAGAPTRKDPDHG